MHNYYIIKSPYTGRLLQPELVTSIESEHGLHYLKEYPLNPDADFMDYYSVLVPENELYVTGLEAYRALTHELLYKIKSFAKTLDHLY